MKNEYAIWIDGAVHEYYDSWFDGAAAFRALYEDDPAVVILDNGDHLAAIKAGQDPETAWPFAILDIVLDLDDDTEDDDSCD